MEIMSCRYEMLKQAIDGYNITNTPLIAYDGKNYLQAGFSDDIGSYYFIPKIAHIFNLSLDQSINLFYYGMFFVALISGFIGMYLLYKNKTLRVFASTAFLLLGIHMFRRTYDVYLANLTVVLGVLPLFLCLLKNNYKINYFYIFNFIAGSLLGIFNQIRSFSGTSMAIFIITAITFNKEFAFKKRLVLILVLGLGLLSSHMYFDFLLQNRNTYLESINVNVKRDNHPFWHTVYCGLGYLPNKYNIKWDDSNAFNKVKMKNNDAVYLSKEYENILKSEVLHLIKSDPYFVIKCYMLKTLKILEYFIKTGIIGLIFIYFSDKKFIDYAFIITLFFNALYGILAIPLGQYLIGFITLGCLYSLYNLTAYGKNTLKFAIKLFKEN